MGSCSIALGLDGSEDFFRHMVQSCKHYSELPIMSFPAPLLFILWPSYLHSPATRFVPLTCACKSAVSDSRCCYCSVRILMFIK